MTIIVITKDVTIATPNSIFATNENVVEDMFIYIYDLKICI